jgi:uncharacterized membrane protein
VSFVSAHFERHMRFYLAAALGIIVGAVTRGFAPQLRLIMAANTFFGVYLVLMTVLVIRLTPDELRRLAGVEDEGIILIVLIALTAICVSLGSIFTLLNQQQKPGAIQLILTLASAPLGWFMLHTIAALQYAHRYYAKSAGGLRFPDTEEPNVWDFIYFSFVIGMTAQVSDVMVLTTHMRRLALAQSVISFFYNTVLLALAVNVAVVLAP